MRHVFVPTADGVVLRLDRGEAEVLRSVFSQLRDLLLAGDETSLRRLYPTAYADHPEFEAEYRSMVHDDLLARRLDALDLVEATLAGPADDPDGGVERLLDDDEMGSWMGCVNDLRLVLGTRLDVSEDDVGIPPGHPEPQLYALYHFLGALLEEAVAAMSP